MNVRVQVAGHECGWRFGGCRRLDAWLRERPWYDRGGVQLVRISGPLQAAVVFDAVEEALSAIEGPGAPFVVIRLDQDALNDGILLALLRHYLINDPASRGEQLRQVGPDLSGSPHALFVAPAEPSNEQRGRTGTGGDRLAEAQLLVDDVFKLEIDATLCIFLCDTPNAPLGGAPQEFVVGYPDERLLEFLHEPETTLWAAYVHHRIAWELGGSVHNAMEWMAEAQEPAECGDDDTLEAHFNRYACHRYDHGLASDEKRRVCANVHSSVSPRPPADGERRVTRELTRQGLLWLPTGILRSRPVPWLARALLIREAIPEARHMLRSCLTSMPLTQEALGRCFELEAYERGVYCSNDLDAVPDSDVDQRYQSFRENPDYLERQLYPRSSPAFPTDPMFFATFGNVVESFPSKPADLFIVRKLYRLRNALAHGHYASWHVVKILRDIERQLMD